MSLARDWTRQLYGAWGAALLAPATMIAALAVLVLGGGFGGLSALGQLLSGPAIPVQVPLAGGHAASRAAPPVLPVVPATTPATPAAPVHVASRTPPVVHRVAPRPAPPRAHGGRPTRIGSGGHGAAPPVKKPPPERRPPPPASPAPRPSPVLAIVNGVVATGESVTSKLPAPLGGPLTNVLQSVGQTLNKLLSPGS